MVRDHDGKGKGSDDMVWVQPVQASECACSWSAWNRMRLDLVQMELSPEELKKWTTEHGG